MLLAIWPLSSSPTVSSELFALFLSCKSSLFIMESSLGQMYALQIFSPVCGLPFFFLTLSFDEVFILMKEKFFTFFYSSCFLCPIKNSLPVPRPKTYSVCSSRSFIVYAFMFRPMIRFRLYLIQ